jgi:MFS family permease
MSVSNCNDKDKSNINIKNLENKNQNENHNEIGRQKENEKENENENENLIQNENESNNNHSSNTKKVNKNSSDSSLNKKLKIKNELNSEEKEKDKDKDNYEENSNLKYKSITEIIDSSGYNLTTIKIIFFAFIFVMEEGFILSYFGNISTAFKQYYQLSDAALEFISSLSFLGMGIGNIIVVFLLKILSRRNIILLSIIGLLITHLNLCLIKTLVAFAISRFLNSIFLGFYMVLMFNILTEYLPTHYRGFFLNAVWIGWNIGAIIFLLLCKIFIPGLSYNSYNTTEPQDFYAAIFHFVYVYIFNFIIAVFFLEDSPRNLLVNNEKERARNVLKNYIGRELSKEELEKLQYDILNSGENKHHTEENSIGLNQLFSKRMFMLSILMMLVFFFLSFSTYGINVAIPIIIKKIEELKIKKFLGNQGKGNLNRNLNININPQSNISNTSNLRMYNYNYPHSYGYGNSHDCQVNSLIIIYSITASSSIIGGIMAEMRSLGKKYCEIILFSLSLLFASMCPFFLFHFEILISISVSLLITAFNLHISWTGEILPTKLRDFGFGLFISMTRFGGFFTQYVFISVAHLNFQLTIWIYILSILILLVLITFLPRNNVIELDSELELDEMKEI